jgi:hypothetical protein
MRLVMSEQIRVLALDDRGLHLEHAQVIDAATNASAATLESRSVLL